jgi:hypothetical protein
MLVMLGFALTGVTLNHAGDIVAQPVVRHAELALPANIRAQLDANAVQGDAPLPAPVAAWLDAQFSVSVANRDAEWSADEIYLTLTRPGADGSISLDRRNGQVVFEESWRGWIAFFNDLHKGRNAGPYWSWFIDIFAAACVLFCLTGLGILYLKAGARRATWPLIGAGLMLPLLIVLLFAH